MSNQSIGKYRWAICALLFFATTVVGIGGMAGGLGGVAVSQLGDWVFEACGARGDLSTGHMLMLSLCAVAYLVAWAVMKGLVPRHREVVFALVPSTECPRVVPHRRLSK